MIQYIVDPETGYWTKRVLFPRKGFENNRKRRKHSPEYTARVVLESINQQKRLSQVRREHKARGSVFSRWKQDIIGRNLQVFEQGKIGRTSEIGNPPIWIGLLDSWYWIGKS